MILRKLYGKREVMINIEKYIKDDRVLREEIVNDILDQKLEKKELLELLKNNIIKNSFFGGKYSKKNSKNQWTEEYLSKISLASIAEYFNEDYLMYLYEVAEFVKEKKKKQKLIKISIFLLALLIIILIIIVFIFWMSKDMSNYKELK